MSVNAKFVLFLAYYGRVSGRDTSPTLTLSTFAPTTEPPPLLRPTNASLAALAPTDTQTVAEATSTEKVVPTGPPTPIPTGDPTPNPTPDPTPSPTPSPTIPETCLSADEVVQVLSYKFRCTDTYPAYVAWTSCG